MDDKITEITALDREAHYLERLLVLGAADVDRAVDRIGRIRGRQHVLRQGLPIAQERKQRAVLK